MLPNSSLSPKRIIFRNLSLAACTLLFFASFAGAQAWRTIDTDDAGDAAGGLDATKLEYRYDVDKDSLFFRVTVSDLDPFSDSPAADFSFTLPNGLDNGDATYELPTAPGVGVHKTLFIYTDLDGEPPSDYMFTAFDNKIEVGAMQAETCLQCISVFADVPNNQLTYGVRRRNVITNSEMKGNSAVLGIVANVGHEGVWNDNITTEGTIYISRVGDLGPVGIDTPEETLTVQVFPNPGNGQMQIGDLPQALVGSQLSVHNTLGQQVYQSQAWPNSALDLQHLNPGIYMLRIEGEDQTAFARIVIR